MRARTLTLLVLWLVLPLWGCGDDDPGFAPPPGAGLVALDDRPAVEITAPLLRVQWRLPGDPEPKFSHIYSDPLSDGDIAFNPRTFLYTISMEPRMLLFGIDRADPDLPEYRAFLDFPLDIIPLDAQIDFASVEVFVLAVNYSAVIPTFLDLVQYDLFGLTPQDFDSDPFLFRTLEFFSTDQGAYVEIDVTPLMKEAQKRSFAEFQVRFLVDFTRAILSPEPPAKAPEGVR